MIRLLLFFLLLPSIHDPVPTPMYGRGYGRGYRAPTASPTRAPTYTPLPTATKRVPWQGETCYLGTRPANGAVAVQEGKCWSWATPTPMGKIAVVGADLRVSPQRAEIYENQDSTTPAIAMVAIGLLLLIFVGVLALYFLRRSERWRLMLAKQAAKRDPVEVQRRKAIKEHQKQEKRRRKTLKETAKFLGKQVTEVLANVGYVHEYRNPGQKKKLYEKIKFSHAVIVGEEQVLLRVHRVPYRKSRWDLFSNAPGQSATNVDHGTTVVSWYAAELYLALERRVQVTFYEEIGILIQIALKQGIAGVPRLVLWRDEEAKRFSMMLGDPFNDGKGAIRDPQKYPETRYQINVGLGRNRKVIRQDLRSLPHLIVSGTTGSGKSNFLNQMISTWLERNTPETLNLYLLDLKIMEFAPYLRLSKDDSHVIGPSMVVNVVQDEFEAAEELQKLYNEIVRRQKLMAGVCIDLDGWNSYAREDPASRTMPRIVVVFDELSIIMLNKKKIRKRAISSIALEFLAKCVAVGRSVGVHMILCTQVVSKQVLDLLVQGNTPGKMIFRQANRTASINALGDGRAWSHLQQSGMGFFCDEIGNETIVQTPLILEAQRDRVIERELARIQGRADQDQPLTIQDVVEYAVRNYRGKMRQVDMFAKFKGRITQKDLRDMLSAHFDHRIYLGLREYVIFGGARGIATEARCVSLAPPLIELNQKLENPIDEIRIHTPSPSNDEDNGHQPMEIVLPDDLADEDDDNDVDELDYQEYLELTRRPKNWSDD